MSRYTKQDIIRMVEDEDVEFIRLQFTDIFGSLKNIAVTISQLDKVLNNDFMFDGAALEGFVNVEEADMYLYPDLDTFTIFPWRPQQGKVARFICDVYKADKTPFEGDPRYILKKVIKEAQMLGYSFDAGPECEFFLFHTDEQGLPTTVTHEHGGYFDVGPVDLGENARREMVLTLESMGFEIESSHHEAAPAQHEIDFRYDNALKTADNMMTFKFVVRTIAKRHGLHATFMPKPRIDSNGSGMHINMSLSKEGKNIFADTSDERGLSKQAYYFISGLMNHMKGMTAITNPLVNSYKRLTLKYEAPVYIAWSSVNRTPLIRIPFSRGEETRIELRSPDACANPYLALAVCLASGLEGIKKQQMPPEGIDKNIFTMSEEERKDIERLPVTLSDAIEALKEDKFVQSILGKQLCEKYISEKEKEWVEYCNSVSQWEIDNYLQKF